MERPSLARAQTTRFVNDYPECDEDFARLVAELWGEAKSEGSNGRVISSRTAREVLVAEGVKPDFEFGSTLNPQLLANVDYIHRRDGDAEIYFVANRSTNSIALDCTFRVAGKSPELWQPVSGERCFAVAYHEQGGRTTLPLEFAPCGSWLCLPRAGGKHRRPPRATRHRFRRSQS